MEKKESKAVIPCVCKDGAKMPVYASGGAAGADVSAFINEEIVVLPGSRRLIPTGLFFEIPKGYEIQVRPRSGLALKNGITVLNAPGTIDSDYRGELMVILINHSNEPFTITNGMRIAQIVVAEHAVGQFEQKEDMVSSTERGSGSFGHTGLL